MPRRLYMVCLSLTETYRIKTEFIWFSSHTALHKMTNNQSATIYSAAHRHRSWPWHTAGQWSD